MDTKSPARDLRSLADGQSLCAEAAVADDGSLATPALQHLIRVAIRRRLHWEWRRAFIFATLKFLKEGN